MSDWHEVSLSQLGEVNRGRSRHRPRYAEHLYGGPYPFIQTGDVKASRGRISTFSQTYSEDGLAQSRLWPAGTMCITIAANIAETSVLDFPACFPDSIVGFIPDAKKADVRFVEYVFRTLRADLQHQASGSVQDNINLETLARLKFSVPALSEQQAIAEVLGALDDKIAANTKVAATSEELIATHFQDAINSGGTSPKPLFDVVNIDFGEPFKGADFSEPGTGRPLIRIRDLKTFRSQVWTTESRPGEVMVVPGDVVVGMDAEFRPTSWLGEPGLLNQRVCRARGKATGPAFVREALKEPLSRIERYKTATTVIHLNKKDLMETVVLVPGATSLRSFEESVERLYSHRVALALENRTLAATRDALLPQLMSGKLRVKDAESLVTAAV